MIASMSFSCKCIVMLFSASLGLIPEGVTPDDAQAFYRLLQEAPIRHRAGKTDEARQMIQAAKMIASHAYNKVERASWQLNIMDAQIAIGELEDAKETLGYVDVASSRFRGWCLLAKAYYASQAPAAGDQAVVQAMDLLSEVGVEGVPELAAVAREAQAAGQIDAAKRIVDKAQKVAVQGGHSSATREGFVEIGTLLVELGEHQRAVRLVVDYPAADNEAERIEAMARIYAEIARQQNLSGQAKEAVRTFAAMGELLEQTDAPLSHEATGVIIEAYLAGDRIQQASAIAEGLEDAAAEAYAWLQIATYLRQGRSENKQASEVLQKAARAGARIVDEKQQQQVLLRVVRAMNQAREFGAALSAADAIELPQHKAMAYCRVAEAQHAAGETEAALNSYKWARETIRADEVKWRRELSWKHLILSMKRTGLQEQAETWQLSPE
jgi:hypothetical protein